MVKLITAALAAFTLIFAAPANAGTIEDVAALGYATNTTFTQECTESPFAKHGARGFGASVSFGCINQSGYQDAIDAFISGHNERRFIFENPGAVAARDEIVAKGYSVSMSFPGPTFSVTGDCKVNASLTAETIGAFNSALAPSAPCPVEPVVAPTPPEETGAPAPAPPSDEPAPEPAPSDPAIADLEQQIHDLQAALAALASRVTASIDANKAAWSALVLLLGEGRPAYEAALGARSAGLNALYNL